MAFSSDNCGNFTGLCDIFCLNFLPDLRQIWNSQGSAATYLRCGGEWYMGFYWKFRSLSSGKRILKIGWDLTKLPPWVCGTLFGTRCMCKVANIQLQRRPTSWSLSCTILFKTLLKFFNIYFSVVYNATIVWWIKIFNFLNFFVVNWIRKLIQKRLQQYSTQLKEPILWTNYRTYIPQNARFGI